MNNDLRGDALSESARKTLRQILQAFAVTGQPPARAELDTGALDELAKFDAIALDAAGEIRAAYPFSPVPTPVRVSWADGPEAYAMCAIDALGMSAMLGRKVTITATEPGSGRVITVEVDGDRARWQPRTAVVLAAGLAGAEGPSVDTCCSTISFFATKRAARAWASGHPGLTGVIMRRHGALASGIAQFGAQMRTE
jgi:hypothetical protein